MMQNDDFVEKPKTRCVAPPLGKWMYPKSERVANVTHFGREGHVYDPPPQNELHVIISRF